MAELDRNLDQMVARMVSQSGELDATANAIAEDAKSGYAGHGDMAGFVHVERLNPYDLQVVNDHPFASFVELGHMAVNPTTGEATGRWVSGVHALRNAARKSGGY